MVKSVKFRASDIQPNPEGVTYWVDLNADASGKIIKTWNSNTNSWVPIYDNTDTRNITEHINYNDICGKPAFAAVSYSGSYNDLIDKPDLLSTYQLVSELPKDNINPNKIYLTVDAEDVGIFRAYAYIDSEWILLDESKYEIDLRPYLLKADAESLYQPKGDYVLKSELPNIQVVDEIIVPTKISELTNDSNFLTNYTETDPTVPAHVKSIKQTDIDNWNSKSTFSGDYNDLQNKPIIPDTNEFVNKSEWQSNNTIVNSQVSSKQDFLVSGANIKTINGYSILGTGDLIVSGDGNILEAPTNGKKYARKDSTWTEVNEFSGSYVDLTNKPTSLPASDVYEWAKSSSKPSYDYSEIKGKPTFATVATSGDYNDLSNKPTPLHITGVLYSYPADNRVLLTFSGAVSSKVWYLKGSIKLTTDEDKVYTITCNTPYKFDSSDRIIVVGTSDNYETIIGVITSNGNQTINIDIPNYSIRSIEQLSEFNLYEIG